MKYRDQMIKEIIKYHTSVGRQIKTDEEWEKATDESIQYYDGMIGNEPIPKDRLIKFYEAILNSELGYTEEDKTEYNSSIFFKLNSYSAWLSWHNDINELGEMSANYGKDFKKRMLERYEEVKKTFI